MAAVSEALTQKFVNATERLSNPDPEVAAQAAQDLARLGQEFRDIIEAETNAQHAAHLKTAIG